MLKFEKFPSLENTYNQKKINKIENLGIDSIWVVTEKVHGANFSFWVERNENEIVIKCAKRSGFIEDDEKFFNYKPVLERYKESLIKLYQQLECDSLIVYGELYGGNVQRGMSYKDDQDFIAFDMVVDNVVQEKIYSFNVLKSFNITVTPLIGVYGNIKDALDVNESFDSNLTCENFSGVELHKEAEGIVIEPNIPHWDNSGSRVYLKKKTKRFLEKSGKPKTEHKQPSVLNEKVQMLLDESKLYINEARYQSVVSKIGEVSIKDIGKVMGLMTQDVLVDLEKDLEKSVEDTLEDKGLKTSYMKNLQKSVQDFVKPILLNT